MKGLPDDPPPASWRPDAMTLSILLTCYNEAQEIAACHDTLVATLSSVGLDPEFVIVDDGSRPDQQRKLAEQFLGLDRVHIVLFEENRGRGAALSEGIRAATGDCVCVIDTDLEIPATAILAGFCSLDGSAADMAIAERFYRWPPRFRDWARNIASKAYRAFSSSLLPLEGLDTETGFKAFRRSRVLEFLDRVKDERFFWDTEIVSEALRAGQNVVQFPVVVCRRTDKRSSVRLFRDTWRYLKGIHAYRARLRLPGGGKDR